MIKLLWRLFVGDAPRMNGAPLDIECEAPDKQTAQRFATRLFGAGKHVDARLNRDDYEKQRRGER